MHARWRVGDLEWHRARALISVVGWQVPLSVLKTGVTFDATGLQRLQRSRGLSHVVILKFVSLFGPGQAALRDAESLVSNFDRCFGRDRAGGITDPCKQQERYPPDDKETLKRQRAARCDEGDE